MMAVKQASMATRWASETDVAAAIAKTRANREAQARDLRALNDRIERRAGDIAKSLSDLPAQQRTPTVNRAVAGFRAELKRDSADRRLIYVRAAGEQLDFVSRVRSHYASPVQMLMRQSLGSERRSRLMQQLANSGPAELASFAELAAATKDAELAAALCSRVAEIDVAKRPFAPGELADAIVGDEFRKVTQALMEIERVVAETAHDDTAFETGGRNPHRDLTVALMRRAEDEAGADPFADEEG